MKLMVKTDRCVKLLETIQHGLWPYCFKFDCNTELAEIIKEADNKGEAIRQYYRNKLGEDIFQTDERAIQMIFDKNGIFRRLALLKALTTYVLSPVVEIAGKNKQLAYAGECLAQDPYKNIILNTIESFGEPIYVKDLEDEFMEVCPDMDSIGKYLPLALSKYDKIKLPYRGGISMDDLVFGNNNYSHHIRNAEYAGLITQKEAETILVTIWQVISRTNEIYNWIKEMYAKIESLIPSDGSNNACPQTPPIAQCAHFTIEKNFDEMQRILTTLQQQGFVSANTEIKAFYYRMTGNGEPVQGRICWIKKAKNKAISLTSLIDFLVTIGVELESALSQVDDVFRREDGRNIKLPNDTKTTARKKRAHSQDLSEYHQTIMAIIDDGQTTKCNS